MKKQIEQLKDHFVICGFGRIGKTVCEQLFDGDVPFVVIEYSTATPLAAPRAAANSVAA